MVKKIRKRISSEEKVSLIRKHLVEKVPVSDICDKHSIHPNVFYRWEKEFFDKGFRAFEGNGKSSKNASERKIVQLEAKLAKKDEVISELMEDHVKLKKSLGEI